MRVVALLVICLTTANSQSENTAFPREWNEFQHIVSENEAKRSCIVTALEGYFSDESSGSRISNRARSALLLSLPNEAQRLKLELLFHIGEPGVSVDIPAITHTISLLKAQQEAAITKLYGNLQTLVTDTGATAAGESKDELNADGVFVVPISKEAWTAEVQREGAFFLIEIPKEASASNQGGYNRQMLFAASSVALLRSIYPVWVSSTDTSDSVRVWQACDKEVTALAVPSELFEGPPIAGVGPKDAGWEQYAGTLEEFFLSLWRNVYRCTDAE